MPNAVQAFYRSNPHMVSSPFGGICDCNTALLKEVFDCLGIGVDGQQVLDVGCGRGFLEEPIRTWGGRYTGVDFVVSRQGFPLVQADASRLPFTEGAFDMVLCVDAFEHFPDPPAALRELRRVLRPGGAFFLSAPNYGNVAGLVKVVSERLGGYARDTWAPFGRWQPQELEQALTVGRLRSWAQAAGFPEVRYSGYGYEVGLGLFPWLDHPRMPEAVRYRGQALARRVGPAIARAWPSASLHVFYRFS